MPAAPADAPDALETLRFEQDRRQLVVAVLVLAIPVVLFAIVDVLTAGEDASRLALLLAIRAIGLGLLVTGIRRLLRVRERQRFGRIVTASSHVVVLLILAVHALRPPQLLTPFFFTLLFIVALYVALPTRWRDQRGPALVLTGGSILFLFFHHTGVVPAERVSIVVMLLAANAIGMSLGWSRTVAERREEAYVRREREARDILERTLGELRVLRGILPICAHCRKVRDERGAWAALEAYVRQHTEAEFSHGICPDCAAEHFPDPGPAPR